MPIASVAVTVSGKKHGVFKKLKAYNKKWQPLADRKRRPDQQRLPKAWGFEKLIY
jgi:hypothetical protein